jgi:prepilin-type N-terminal cleavage/methylation domain-containing protein
MKINRNYNKSKGFSLVEVLVSIFIISITLCGLLAIFIMGKKTLKTDKYRIKALDYAQETLEELRNYVSEPREGSYSHLPNQGILEGDTYSWAFDDGDNHIHTINNSTDVALGFSRVYNVQDEIIGSQTLKRVTITVTYPDVSP